MTTDRGQKTREKVIAAATDLFAEHGYHAVTTRDIAKAAKVNIATIHYHVGTKEELYLEVFRRGYAREVLLVKSFIDEMQPEKLGSEENIRSAIRKFVSDIVDMNVAEPNLAKLSIRRQFTQDDQSKQIDKLFSLPMYREFGEYLQNAIEKTNGHGEVYDLRFFFTGFIWVLNGLVTSGVIDWKEMRIPIDSEPMIAQTKDFIYRYCCTMMGLQP
jgi:AcrR family transcriptional regulator